MVLDKTAEEKYEKSRDKSKQVAKIGKLNAKSYTGTLDDGDESGISSEYSSSILELEEH